MFCVIIAVNRMIIIFCVCVIIAINRMIIIIVLGVGHLTPPVGGAILTACLIGRVTIAEIMKYMWPVIILEVVLAVIILMFPPLTETLPRFFELGGLKP